MWCCFIFYFLVLHTHTTFDLCSDTDDAAYAFVIDGNEMFHLNITQKELVMRLPEFTSVIDCPHCLSIALSAITTCRKNLNTTLKADNYPATHGTLFQSKFFVQLHRTYCFKCLCLCLVCVNVRYFLTAAWLGIVVRHHKLIIVLVSDAPQVVLYPKDEVELAVINTLVCFVNHFHPPPVNIKWAKNNVEVTGGVVTDQYIPHTDVTFYQFSYLTFTPQEGDIYSCTVEHLALESPLTRIWGNVMILFLYKEPLRLKEHVGFRALCCMYEHSNVQLIAIAFIKWVKQKT